MFSVAYLVGAHQWISRIDITSPEICCIYLLSPTSAGNDQNGDPLTIKMADWNGSGYPENSSIDENFLYPKQYFWSASQHPGLH